jgi:hypothetical protein
MYVSGESDRDRLREVVRTPHLALVLLFCILYAQEGSPLCGIVVDTEEGWDLEVKLS